MRALLTPKGLIGLSLVAVFALAAIGSPFLVPEELTTKINVLARLKPPSLEHPSGPTSSGESSCGGYCSGPTPRSSSRSSRFA